MYLVEDIPWLGLVLGSLHRMIVVALVVASIDAILKHQRLRRR